MKNKKKDNNKLPIVLPDDLGIDPNGNQTECQHCNQKVGQSHKSDCQLIRKQVVLEYVMVIFLEVPNDFNNNEIKALKNSDKWLSPEAITEIAEFVDEKGTEIHSGAHCNIFDVPQIKPFRRNSDGIIIP